MYGKLEGALDLRVLDTGQVPITPATQKLPIFGLPMAYASCQAEPSPMSGITPTQMN